MNRLLNSLTHRPYRLGALALSSVLASAAQAGSLAYIANGGGGSNLDNTISVIDTGTNAVVNTITIGQPGLEDFRAVAMNSAATRVYVADYSNEIIDVIDTSNNQVVTTIPVGVRPFGIAVNNADTEVYVVNDQDNSISFIRTSDNTVVETVPVTGTPGLAGGSGPRGIAVNLAGTRLYVSNNSDNTVAVFNVAAGDPMTHTQIDTITVGRTPTSQPTPYGIAVNPAGTRVYVANEGDGTVDVIDTATDTVISNLAVGGTPIAIAVNSDGTRVFVAGNLDGFVTVINGTDNTIVTSVPTGNELTGIAMTLDGTQVYVVDRGLNQVQRLDANSYARLTPVDVGISPFSIGQFTQKDVIFTSGFEAGPK